ncbi:MAG: exodeoxyribonuclease VII large subunit [Bacillota bacterium]|nr:exodeoxyribonuclease VII large subunit [Bacillota bacterium]
MNGFRLKVFTVSEVTGRIQKLLASDPVLRRLTVSGEISNCSKRYDNGTIYFVLKDEAASMKVFYRGPGELRDGMKVRASGSISLYRARGEHQLYADLIEEEGDGDLHMRFEQLKRELEAKGYFSPTAKKPIPARIRSVGIVTSLNGAAIQDMLSVFQRRDAIHRAVLYDVRVQGLGSAEQIRAAIEYFNRDCPVDLIVVTRGGGSIEDLWAFNEMPTVEAIWQSGIPVLSGVGHEVDTTLSDLVADERAATPTAAAERICDVTSRLRYRELLERAVLKLKESSVQQITRREERLGRMSPQNVEQGIKRNLDRAVHRLAEQVASAHRSIDKVLDRGTHRMQKAAVELEALSPLKILDRGYAILEERRPIEAYRVGETVHLHLRDGSLSSQIIEIVRK